jgi:hypothetical protein
MIQCENFGSRKVIAPQLRLWLNLTSRTKPAGYPPTPADKNFVEYSILLSMSRFFQRIWGNVSGFPHLKKVEYIAD